MLAKEHFLPITNSILCKEVARCFLPTYYQVPKLIDLTEADFKVPFSYCTCGNIY